MPDEGVAECPLRIYVAPPRPEFDETNDAPLASTRAEGSVNARCGTPRFQNARPTGEFTF
jgi:hypothetical protein